MVVVASGWRIVIARVGRRVRIRIGVIGIGGIDWVGIRVGDGTFFGAGRKGQQDGGEND
jgi:hypothetical protein